MGLVLSSKMGTFFPALMRVFCVPRRELQLQAYTVRVKIFFSNFSPFDAEKLPGKI